MHKISSKFFFVPVFAFTFLLLTYAVITPTAQAAVSAIETTTSGDSPFSYGAFSLAVMNAENYSSGGTGYFTYNYATINYRVAERQHFSFRIPVTYRSAGFDSFGERNLEQETLLDDLILDFTNSATLLPFDTEMFSRIRYEVPTGKYSRMQKTLGSFRMDLIFSKHIAKGFQLEYWPIFRWNMHTQTVYNNEDTDNLSHTKQYELDQRLNIWYVATNKLAVGGFVGTEDTWLNESKTNSTSRQRDGRLAEHFLKQVADEYGQAVKGIEKQAIEALQQHNWSGNIREFRNVMERLVILSGKMITAEDVTNFVIPRSL